MRPCLLVLGAVSPIAKCTAAAFAEKGWDLFLAARDEDELQRIAADLKIRFPQCNITTRFFDALRYEAHADFVIDAVRACPNLEGVLVAFGTLGDQTEGANDFAAAKKIIDSNFTGACSILTHAANYFAKLGRGLIIGISSVAGDRGRRSNYIYGSAKAAFTAFLQGLRNRLYHEGVHVLTVKLGFVDTAMTYGMPGLFLVAEPESIGKAIAKAALRKRNVVYLPWFWKYIMLIIKLLPEHLFKRLKL